MHGGFKENPKGQRHVSTDIYSGCESKDTSAQYTIEVPITQTWSHVDGQGKFTKQEC